MTQDDESLGNVIKTVVLELHWALADVMDLYIDEQDHFGIMYWYEAIVKMNNELKQKTK